MSFSKELRSYSLIALGALLVSVSYNVFLLPARLAAGGVVGISTLLYDYTSGHRLLCSGVLISRSLS